MTNWVKVHCHTNLDLAECESWPSELPCRPMVGDMVESANHWKHGHISTHLRLRVIQVTMRGDSPVVDVELHCPAYHSTVSDFYDWYERVSQRRFR